MIEVIFTLENVYNDDHFPLSGSFMRLHPTVYIIKNIFTKYKNDINTQAQENTIFIHRFVTKQMFYLHKFIAIK